MHPFDLPKVELHCHLDGILDPAMAAEIRRENPHFPIHPQTLAAAQKAIVDIPTFFAWFQVLSPFHSDLPAYFPILQKYIQRQKACQVRYSELMIPSSEIARDPGLAVEQVSALYNWAMQNEDGQTQVEFLVVFGRGKAPEAAAELARPILALHRAGLIVGVALAGTEIGHPVRPFRNLLAQFHAAGLGIEIHAGEWCGPESIWDALENGFPDRIGHGVSLFQDPRLVDLFVERQIHVEMCLTSNLITGSIARLEDHPIVRARTLGLNFSINTDDPGAFLCNMNTEYERVSALFHFQEADFQQVYENSLHSRFQPKLRISQPWLRNA